MARSPERKPPESNALAERSYQTLGADAQRWNYSSDGRIRDESGRESFDARTARTSEKPDYPLPRVLSATSRKKIHKLKVVKEMHIRKTDNNGYVTKHIHTSFEHPDEEHVQPHMDALHDHMEEHWGEPNDGEEETPGQMEIQKAIGLEK